MTARSFYDNVSTKILKDCKDGIVFNSSINGNILIIELNNIPEKYMCNVIIPKLIQFHFTPSSTELTPKTKTKCISRIFEDGVITANGKKFRCEISVNQDFSFNDCIIDYVANNFPGTASC